MGRLLILVVALYAAHAQAAMPETAGQGVPMANFVSGWQISVYPSSMELLHQPQAGVPVATVRDRSGAPWRFDWHRSQGIDWLRSPAAFRFDGWLPAEGEGEYGFVIELLSCRR